MENEEDGFEEEWSDERGTWIPKGWDSIPSLPPGVTKRQYGRDGGAFEYRTIGQSVEDDD